MIEQILVTGVAGFIGSNFICYMVKKYPNINFIGIDKLSYCSNVDNFKEISDSNNFNFVKADLTNQTKINSIFQHNSIDVIIHFAAYSHVDHSFNDSITFVKNNVIGTTVLLEMSKKYNIKKFIHVSTDEVYGNSGTISSEKSLLNPTNPYSASKAGAEHMCMSYYHSFKTPIIITRGNNVYGPKQYPEKLIPKFIEILLNGDKCTIHGSGMQKRSFLYVDDVCKAFETILWKGKIGEIYNIGTEKEYTVMEITEKLIEKLCGTNNFDEKCKNVQDRPYNDQSYSIDSSKIHSLGWKPITNIDDGIDMTINYYKNKMNAKSSNENKNE